MTNEERQYIRTERDRITRSGISRFVFDYYNDGWCYNCSIPIDLEQQSRYCSPECAKAKGRRSENGYLSRRSKINQ